MFSNLEAEQARHGYTDADIAKFLKIERSTYQKKKQRGTFNLREIKILCILFSKTSEYLFSEEKPQNNESLLSSIQNVGTTSD